MKCYQCSMSAMYQVSEKQIPLCLDCYFKYSQIQQQQIESYERELNFISDQVASVTGMPNVLARYPNRPQPIVVAGAKLQNIHVNNSVIGTINTGSIGTIDQSISAFSQRSEPALAEAIKGLSEAILQSGDLTRNQKNELIESLSVISREAATPKENRQNTVALALLENARKVTALANDITDICQKLWPILSSVFNS